MMQLATHALLDTGGATQPQGCIMSSRQIGFLGCGIDRRLAGRDDANTLL